MLRRVFRTTVSIILVLTVLVNIQIPALQAHASEKTSSAAIVQSQMNGWNAASTLSPGTTTNELPDSAVQQSNAARKPDIGEEIEDNSNVWTQIEDLFTKNTYVRSEGENSVAVIYEDITNNGIKVSNGNKWIDLVPEDGCFYIVATTDSAVRFTNVFDSVDYQFASVAGNAQIKVIYEGQRDNNDFEFSIGCSNGLYVKAQDDGFGVFKNEDPVFTVSAPIAVDIGGSCGDVAVSVSKNGNLLLSVNEDWLSELSRAYPVAVSFTVGGVSQDIPQVVKSTTAI